MSRKKRRTQQHKPSLLDTLGQWIIYIMIGLIPHIYYYTIYETKASELKYFPNKYYGDIYMLAKSRVFLVLSAMLLCVFLYQVLSKRIDFIKDKINIGAGVFAAIIILSSLMSDYQDMVYWGAKDRHEGMWVWLAYVFLFVIARHYGRDMKFVNNTLKVFVYSASVMGVFGLMQMLGYDIYTEGPLRWLCFPREMAANMDMYIVSNTTDRLIAGALYNSNYFGVYMAMASLGALSFSVSEEGRKQWVLVALGALNYGAMIASGSEAALLGFVGALFVYTLYYGETLWQKKKLLVIQVITILISDRIVVSLMKKSQDVDARYIYILLITGFVLGFLAQFFIQKNNLEKIIRRYSMFVAIIVLLVCIVSFNIFFKYVPSSYSQNALRNIDVEGNSLNIEFIDGESLRFEFSKSSIIPYDDSGNVIEYSVNPNYLKVVLGSQRRCVFDYKSYESFHQVNMIKPLKATFAYNNGSVQYVNMYGIVDEIDYPERVNVYSNNSKAFSNRGYLWSTYLPMAFSNLATGTGPDVYLAIFPQNDLLGKSQHSLYNTLVDKPHSLYLDVIISFGIVGLFAFMLMLILITNELLIGNMKNGIAILLLIILFVSGIFNDSVVPICIILFTLAGGVLSPHLEI